MANSTTSRSSALSRATGPSGRGATSSIRRRCSRRWAGRPRRIAAPPPMRASSICSRRRPKRTVLSTFTLDEDALVSRLAAARRGGPREACRRVVRDEAGRVARVRGRGALARSADARRPRAWRAELGRGSRGCDTPGDAEQFHGARAARAGQRLVGQRARNLSRTARSSFSRSTCCGSRKSPTTKR